MGIIQEKLVRNQQQAVEEPVVAEEEVKNITFGKDDAEQVADEAAAEESVESVVEEPAEVVEEVQKPKRGGRPRKSDKKK